MDKKLFLETINALKKQNEADMEYATNAAKLFPDAHEANLLPQNHWVSNQLIKLLQLSFRDNNKDSWIEYFCYELDFGAKYKPGCARFVDGSNIDLSTPEKLYEFLVKECKGEQSSCS